MEFKIEIADICALIKVDDADFAQCLIADHYSNFLSDKEPSLWVRMDVRPVEEASLLDGTLKIIETSVIGEVLYFRGFDGDVEGKINLISGEAEGVTVRVSYRFDAFLRILYSLWLVKSGGFLLHSAGSKDEKEAYVFFGVSGSGKTTVTKLSDDKVILSDELVAVRAVNGRYQAHGTPFMGEFARGGQNCSGDLKRIFLLKKDKKNFLLPIRGAQRLKELFHCVQFFGENTHLLGDLLAICNDISEKVDFYELHFLPDKSFWNCIRNHGGI